RRGCRGAVRRVSAAGAGQAGSPAHGRPALPRGPAARGETEASAMKAIVFDFGNVLGFFDYRRTTTALAAHTDLSADELHRRLYGGPLEHDYDIGRLSTAAFLVQAREACRLRCSAEAFAAAWAAI